MPIYGYRCGNCGHEFEVLQKMSDAPLKTCPKCSGRLTKILYPAGIIYKGSGYYSTDYKGGGSKAAAKAGSNGSSSSSDSGSSSSESKESKAGKPAGESSKSESKASESSSSD
ncbi:MAG TPA: FmdB family zinc ribbon protein [Candidatus Dormibacteraeota bacterium]|nr:FmdB family zinc ribbon protein [Candidatus Dormibacteraeota bacterium]